MRNYIFIFLALLFASCAATKNADIPKNFAPPNLHTTILLVKTSFDEKSVSRSFCKCMDQYYTGRYEHLPTAKLLDKNYPDTSIYRYVLVLEGSLYAPDFNGISNKAIFFDSSGSFSGAGSRLFIFDRSSNHPLYDANVWESFRKSEYTNGNFNTGRGFYCSRFKRYLTFLSGAK